MQQPQFFNLFSKSSLKAFRAKCKEKRKYRFVTFFVALFCEEKLTAQRNTLRRVHAKRCNRRAQSCTLNRSPNMMALRHALLCNNRSMHSGRPPPRAPLAAMLTSASSDNASPNNSGC